jgi:hypothetical protein
MENRGVAQDEVFALLTDFCEVPFQPGKPIDISYKWDKVPCMAQYFSDSTTAKNFDDLGDCALHRSLVVWAYGDIPTTISVHLDFSVVYHWEIVPYDVTAMALRPSPSFYSPDALAQAMAVCVMNCPNVNKGFGGDLRMTEAPTSPWENFQAPPRQRRPRARGRKA